MSKGTYACLLVACTTTGVSTGTDSPCSLRPGASSPGRFRSRGGPFIYALQSPGSAESVSRCAKSAVLTILNSKG